MKIAFFSNFLNHHQLPMCMAFLSHSEIDFKFVACEETHQERLKMNYADMNTQYDFVVRAYEDEDVAMKIVTTYDIVIIGSAPLKYLDARMKLNLVTFRFCERSLKKGHMWRFVPTTRKKIYDGYTKYKTKPLYVLCSGAYVSGDLAICGFELNKCFRWGYFPEIQEKNLDELFELKQKNTVPEILYAGRLLKLKHVMDIVKAVHVLKKQGTKVHFTIIGEGEAEKQIRKYIHNNSLDDYISIFPFIKPKEVRGYMDKADIYVFSSNFYEGWGAVVNEAMNSACAVVVSHAVGSAAYLINSGENGYVYEFGNVNELSEKLAVLAIDNQLREKFGREAYKTISEDWTAENAVVRFCGLCKLLLNNKDDVILYNDCGPCSGAKVIKNRWYKHNRNN